MEAADKVAVNEDLRAHYQKLIGIRNTYPALRIGDYKTLKADNSHDVFAFQRQAQGQTLWVILNNSAKAQRVRLPSGSFSRFDDLLNGGIAQIDGGELSVELPAHWGGVLLAH